MGMNKIIKAEKSDIEPLCALLADAFMCDPLYRCYLPDESARRSALFQIFRKYFTECWDSITLLTTPERGAVLCICPSDAKEVPQIALPTEVQAVYEQINQTVAPRFYSDYLVLDLLAVRPDQRGQGLARAMVEEFRRAVMESGRRGIVEIYEPNNLEFYQKLGFRVAHIQPVGETLTAYLLEV